MDKFSGVIVTVKYPTYKKLDLERMHQRCLVTRATDRQTHGSKIRQHLSEILRRFVHITLQ